MIPLPDSAEEGYPLRRVDDSNELRVRLDDLVGVYCTRWYHGEISSAKHTARCAGPNIQLAL